MEPSRWSKLRPFADAFGSMGSAACALHCLLLPTLIVAGTVVPGSFLGSESFHLAMLAIIFPSAILAFALGCWQHKDRWVLLLGIAGLVGMLMAVTVMHDLGGETGERVVTFVSSILLISAHWRNFKLCRAGH